MPPEAGPLGTPLAWLRRAKSNLARAKQPKPDEAVWEDLCFDAQQAAEKALKAILILGGIDFPRTHSIRVLLSLVEPTGQHIPQELREAIGLTTYATVSRYPGAAEPVTEDEYREAVALAEKMVQWAEKILSIAQE
jgi:HEPN domain-containing protein